MMYYNKITRELSSIPPWGTAFLMEKIRRLRYPDWIEVADDFIPPESPRVELAETEVSGQELDVAAALIEIYDILEEREKHEDL